MRQSLQKHVYIAQLQLASCSIHERSLLHQQRFRRQHGTEHEYVQHSTMSTSVSNLKIQSVQLVINILRKHKFCTCDKRNFKNTLYDNKLTLNIQQVFITVEI